MSEFRQPRDPRILLSALWVSLINIIFRDIHQFLSPGYLDWVIAGELFGLEVTDELLLFGGIAVEVMILMVLMPHVLPHAMIRPVNTIASIFSLAVILSSPPIDPDDIFFLAICIATLVGATWVGWHHFGARRIRADAS